MGKFERDKGQRGERLFIQAMEDAGYPKGILTRNLNQTRNGGADIIDVPTLAIETKNHKTLTIPAWWKQALSQTTPDNPIPILAYKPARKPFAVMVPCYWLFNTQALQGHTATIDVETFVFIVLKYGLVP